MFKIICFLFGHKYKYERDANNRPKQPYCKRCGHKMTNSEFVKELIESIQLIGGMNKK